MTIELFLYPPGEMGKEVSHFVNVYPLKIPPTLPLIKGGD
jgi:hypothetical protein